LRAPTVGELLHRARIRVYTAGAQGKTIGKVKVPADNDVFARLGTESIRLHRVG
jgi:hypothetical protein